MFVMQTAEHAVHDDAGLMVLFVVRLVLTIASEHGLFVGIAT